MREARCAVAKDKPLSLMHDPVRGGAPLNTIINDECPVEMRGHIFADRSVITFHRIKDFQVVSIKLLAQEVLQECPNFKIKHLSSQGNLRGDEKPDVQLSLPGEVTRKKLSFDRPITVYVSPHNPGAAAAMVALQEGFQTLGRPTKRLSLMGRTSKGKLNRSTASRDENSTAPASTPAPVSGSAAKASTSKATASTSRGPIRTTETPPRDVMHREGVVLEHLMHLAANKMHLTKRGTKEATHMLLYLNDETFVGEEGELFANEVRCAHTNGFPVVMVHENDEAAGGCEFARFFETTPQDLISDGLYSALAYAWYPDPFRQVSVALVAQAFGADEPLSMSMGGQAKRLGRRAMRNSRECLTMLGGAFQRGGDDASVEVPAPSTTIAPLDPEAQAEAQAVAPTEAPIEAAAEAFQLAGTLHKRSPTSGFYKKVNVMIEGATLSYLELKSQSSSSSPSLKNAPSSPKREASFINPTLSVSDVERLEVINRANLEFALLTKRSGPEQGRTHSFRVTTCANI